MERVTMKLSDYIAEFLAQKRINHVFAISGGASLHLIDSVRKHEQLKITYPLHEQAAAMAADGYSRASGHAGAAIATSGPGATNLLTGVACAYYDSIPILFLTGQVASFRMKGNTGVRQIGFQETEIVSMCSPITKYAKLITDPHTIRYELEKAYEIATSGRQGPVLIDIPDDFQRIEINPSKLPEFSDTNVIQAPKPEFDFKSLTPLLRKSQRPVLIIGAGVRLAKAENEVMEFISKVPIPFAPTWAAADIFPFDHPQNVGTFGTHGTRHGNFSVQNADLILSIGSRLDTKATGSPPSTFARAATKIAIDIDQAELSKFEALKIDIPVVQNAKSSIRELLKLNLEGLEWNNWATKIQSWKKRYPACKPEYIEEQNLNPYAFVKAFSHYCPENAQLFLDTGCLLPWIMQAFENRNNQRIYHDWNNTAMGWSIPASIGGYFANTTKPTFCIIGDGSLQMNIQELATISSQNLPIKIILFNNHGYSMIRQTQDQWFKSEYFASSSNGGLADPNYLEIARAYGIETVSIKLNSEIDSALEKVMSSEGSILCQVDLSPLHRVSPQVRFGRPNEDAEPLLPRSVFKSEMIIEPHESSETEA